MNAFKKENIPSVPLQISALDTLRELGLPIKHLLEILHETGKKWTVSGAHGDDPLGETGMPVSSTGYDTICMIEGLDGLHSDVMKVRLGYKILPRPPGEDRVPVIVVKDTLVFFEYFVRNNKNRDVFRHIAIVQRPDNEPECIVDRKEPIVPTSR